MYSGGAIMGLIDCFYKQNKINLMTRTELTNFLTSIHVMNRKERKQALNAFK